MTPTKQTTEQAVALDTPHVAAGWQLVPKTPTALMLTTLWNRKDVDAPAQLEDAWRAMLAATPRAPEPEALIAAAPELLEALRAVLRNHCAFSDTPSTDLAFDAIAKATGVAR